MSWAEVAPGVKVYDSDSRLQWQGPREAMEASGLFPPHWFPPAEMKRPQKVFVHQNCAGESVETRRRKGERYGWITIILMKNPGPPQGWHFLLTRSMRGDRQLQRLLREATKLDLVQGEEG